MFLPHTHLCICICILGSLKGPWPWTFEGPENSCQGKGVPWNIENRCFWPQAFKFRVYGTLNKTFITILVIWAFYTNNLNQGLWDFGKIWSSGSVLGPPLWGKTKTRPWYIIHWMPCSTPSRFFNHLNFLGQLGPTALMYSEWDSTFHQWINLDFKNHGPSSSSVKFSLLAQSLSNIMYGNHSTIAQ